MSFHVAWISVNFAWVSFFSVNTALQTTSLEPAAVTSPCGVMNLAWVSLFSVKSRGQVFYSLNDTPVVTAQTAQPTMWLPELAEPQPATTRALRLVGQLIKEVFLRIRICQLDD